MQSFEGALVCRRDRSKGIIVLNSAIREPGRKRFTVCHEIGHFILPGHGEADCQANKIESWKTGPALRETDANRFASELLLPGKLVYEFASKHKVSVDSAKQLSNEYETSLTAAAFKLVDVAEERVALLWSKGGRVAWFHKSESFLGYLAGGALDEQSIAAGLTADRSPLQKEGQVFAECWLSSDALSGKHTLWEDSIVLPYYDSVLTILTQD